MSSTSTPTRRNVVIGIVVVAVVAVAAVAWFLTRPAPTSVDIDSAADAVSGASEDAADGAATSAPATGDGVEGTWTVDTSIGSFSVEDTTGAFVGFRIDEELSTIGSTEAVGRTPAVEGSITIDGTELTAAEFTADMTQIVSDQSRREGAIQRALDTGTSPDATFVLTEPVEIGEVAPGETVEADAVGDLTVAGTTQSITMPLQAQLTDEGVIVVTGSLDITMTDFGVTPPSAPIVVSVSDTATIELQLYLTR